MKNIAIFSVIAFLLITVSGCSYFYGFGAGAKSNTEISDELMEAFLSTLEEQDTEGLISLFAPNALKEVINIHADIDLMYSYYQGNYCSYDNWSATSCEISRESGHVVMEYYGTYDVITDMETYRFAFRYVAEDSTDRNNVGIRSIYVIKMEDDTDPQYAYRGDGLYTPGIQIGVPNILPEVCGSDKTE